MQTNMDTHRVVRKAQNPNLCGTAIEGEKVFTVTYSVNGNSMQKVLRKSKEGRLGQGDEGSYLGSGSLLIDRILQGGSKRSSKTGGKGNNKKTMHFLALLHYQPRWK